MVDIKIMETLKGGERKNDKLENMNINTGKMVLVKNATSVQIENYEFVKLVNEAKSFLKNHRWCKEIEKQWFVANWDNLLTIFFFKIVPNSELADDHIWVVVGDLPTAYIDIESASNKAEVIQVYTEIMDDWVRCVKNGESVEDCYSINVPPKLEYAKMLDTKIQLIKEHILDKMS